MDAGLVIYNILNGDSTISDLVTGIFPLVAPQTTNFPFIIYEVDGDTPTDTKDGASTVDVMDVMVSCYSNNYAEASDIANHVRSALDRKAAGTYGGVQIETIVFTGVNDLFDDNHELGIFRKALDFNIRIIRNV